MAKNTNTPKNPNALVSTALMTALCCIATIIIRIPTPTMGYINLGDGFVLLSSLLLGPVLGPLAGGLGSCLADIFSGYILYAPATFVIKFLTSLTAYALYHLLTKKLFDKKSILPLILSGAIGELVMVIGYFIFEIFMLSATTDQGLSVTALSSGAIAALTGVPANLLQAVLGVVICALLYPILKNILRTSFSE